MAVVLAGCYCLRSCCFYCHCYCCHCCCRNRCNGNNNNGNNNNGNNNNNYGGNNNQPTQKPYGNPEPTVNPNPDPNDMCWHCDEPTLELCEQKGMMKSCRAPAAG